MSAFILVHQYFCLRSMYILMDPRWMEYAKWCASSNISLLSVSSWGTHIRSSYHSIPCLSTLNPGVSFLALCFLSCCIFHPFLGQLLSRLLRWVVYVGYSGCHVVRFVNSGGRLLLLTQVFDLGLWGSGNRIFCLTHPRPCWPYQDGIVCSSHNP